MEGGPPIFTRYSTKTVLLNRHTPGILITGLSPSLVGHSNHSSILALSVFARRYLRNRGCFLFLRVLRCFSSPGLLPYPIHSGKDTLAGGFPHSESLGSQPGYRLPQPIVGSNVFHRLWISRHPPCALISFVAPTDRRILPPHSTRYALGLR